MPPQKRERRGKWGQMRAGGDISCPLESKGWGGGGGGGGGEWGMCGENYHSLTCSIFFPIAEKALAMASLVPVIVTSLRKRKREKVLITPKKTFCIKINWVESPQNKARVSLWPNFLYFQGTVYTIISDGSISHELNRQIYEGQHHNYQTTSQFDGISTLLAQSLAVLKRRIILPLKAVNLTEEWTKSMLWEIVTKTENLTTNKWKRSCVDLKQDWSTTNNGWQWSCSWGKQLTALEKANLMVEER